MSSEVAIRVKNISKCFEMYDKPHHRLQQMLCMGKRRFYKEFWALKNIDFEVKKGECVGVIGRNGAGKSTLLQIITGTLTPTTGSVELKGRVAALLELGSGFNPEFTGRENVFMNAAILGLSRKETEACYQQIIDFADIGDFIHQPVKTYSSGMKVRLAFAVQIMVEPDILIVDEALSVGDMFFQQKCYHHLRKLCEQGMTLFFVSHNLATVRSLCERAVYLKNGRMSAIGDSKEICDLYWNDSTEKTPAAPAAALPSSAQTKERAHDRVPFRIDANLSKRLSDRVGSMDLEITAVDIYNAAGKTIATAAHGEMLKVVASFRANRDVPAGASYAFSARTATSSGLLLMASNLYGMLLPAMKAGEQHTIETEFENPFFIGSLFFSFSLKPEQEVEVYYDHIFNAALLHAVAAAEMKKLGAAGLFFIKAPRLSLDGEAGETDTNVL